MKKIFMLATAVVILCSCNDQSQSTQSETSNTEPKELITEVLTKDKQQELTPDIVLASLREGNERYIANKQLPRDL